LQTHESMVQDLEKHAAETGNREDKQKAERERAVYKNQKAKFSDHEKIRTDATAPLDDYRQFQLRLELIRTMHIRTEGAALRRRRKEGVEFNQRFIETDINISIGFDRPFVVNSFQQPPPDNSQPAEKLAARLRDTLFPERERERERERIFTAAAKLQHYQQRAPPSRPQWVRTLIQTPQGKPRREGVPHSARQPAAGW
jgi:hypothetical protein